MMDRVTVVKEFFSRNETVFKMGLTALVMASVAALVAGLFLESMEEFIIVIPGMMILIYSAIGMRGNIFGAMGSRLGTSMHMGTFEMSLRKGGVIRTNVEAAIALTFVVSLAMGIIAWGVVDLLNMEGTSIWNFMFISLTGGILAGFVLLFVNLGIAKIGHEREWDTDNITAPLIAAAGDIVTMPMLFLAAWFVLNHDEYVMPLTTLMIIFTVLIMVWILQRRPVKSRMDTTKRILIQSTPILIICLVLDVIAGLVMEGEKDSLLALTALLILTPAFLNEGNALSGMLTSRLSSMIHLGTLKVQMLPGKKSFENFAITYILGMITYAFIGTIAFLATWLLYGPPELSYPEMLAIILTAGLIATTVLNFLSYYVAVLATRYNLDPDDHSIPITSSSMDLVSALVFIGVLLMFLPMFT